MAMHFKPGVNATPIGDESITLGAGVQGLTGPASASANAAFITVEIASVRWRDNGADPTSSLGQKLSPGQVLEYTGKLDALKFLRLAAGAQLKVTYYDVRVD